MMRTKFFKIKKLAGPGGSHSVTAAAAGFYPTRIKSVHLWSVNGLKDETLVNPG